MTALMYSLPFVSAQEFAALESRIKVTPKILRYSSDAARLRHRRPNFSGRLDPYDVQMTDRRSSRPKNHAGNATEAYVLLALPGGIRTMRRRISPRSTFSNASIKSR